MQVSCIVTQSATHMPVAEGTTGGSKHTDVEEVIRRDQELFAQILRFLIHSVYTYHVLPSVPFRRLIVDIVVKGVQFEVESALIVFLILLTTVLLIAHQQFQGTVTHQQ